MRQTRRGPSGTDPLEVIELGSEAILTGLPADDDETPAKDRTRRFTSARGEVEKLLATEIKEVWPRQVRKPYWS